MKLRPIAQNLTLRTVRVYVTAQIHHRLLWTDLDMHWAWLGLLIYFVVHPLLNSPTAEFCIATSCSRAPVVHLLGHVINEGRQPRLIPNPTGPNANKIQFPLNGVLTCHIYSKHLRESCEGEWLGLLIWSLPLLGFAAFGILSPGEAFRLVHFCSSWWGVSFGVFLQFDIYIRSICCKTHNENELLSEFLPN